MERNRTRKSKEIQKSSGDAKTPEKSRASQQLAPSFEKAYTKIRHRALQERVDNLILKIVSDPFIGKPIRYERKGTREVYLPPFRMSYHYDENTKTVTFLALYHKDMQ